jgi:hypothetical protein
MADGITTLNGGMDSGRAPSIISPNQCAYAGNITFRGGYAKTRPGFKRIPLATGAAATAFSGGRFQGATYFDYSTGQLVAQVGGSTYKLEPPSSGTDWVVTDITNSITMSTARERVHYVQAEGNLICQDGTNRPQIWNGSTMRRSSAAADEVPIGTGPMAYGQGRLWVAQGRNFVAGDIVGGSNGVLKFTENSYLAGGGAFTVPTGGGNITSMRFVAAPNTGLGQGELAVFTADAAYSVVVPPDRYDWFAVSDPVQRVMLIHNGSLSHYSTELVNGDVFFRSRDGIRSVIQAVRDFQSLGNTPMSREMHRVLKYDEPKYLGYTSAVLFDNRYLLTAQSDHDNDTGIGFKGLVALDFDLISGMSGNAPPAYDGFWTLDITRSSTLNEMSFLQLVTGQFSDVERCFSFARNDAGDTELWELTLDGDEIEDTDIDSTGANIANKITSELETPSFNFKTIGAAKTLESGDLWVDELAGGTVTFHADFHPDQYPCWVSWQDWSVIAEYVQEDCNSLVDYMQQYRPRMRLGMPSEAEEPATGKPFNYGWEFAARLKWTGHARVKLFRLNARETQEEPYADVNIDGTSKAIACDCLGGVSSITNQ